MQTSKVHGFSSDFRAIKHNHLFLVDDPFGQIPLNNMVGLGFYYLDTRFLSGYELLINDERPITLLSSIEGGNQSTIVYTNTQIESNTSDHRQITIPQETVLIRRETILNEAWFERYTLINYNNSTVTLKLTFRFEVDFRDIFEVRSLYATGVGQKQQQYFEGNQLTFALEDDGGALKTRVEFLDFTPAFHSQNDAVAEFSVVLILNAMEQKDLNFLVRPVHSRYTCSPPPAGFSEALHQTNISNQNWSRNATAFESDNEDFNEMLLRSHQDISMLSTRMNGCHGGETADDSNYAYIAAGIPWYVALFGRDSLITARSCLMLKPEIARDTLFLLARYQGTQDNPWRDEQPGKILHELRVGELARHGKIPHTPYYGTVDATPLWIILLYDYFLWTRDRKTLEALWPNALRAMAWIDNNLAGTPLGYLYYKTESSWGLHHQGWKDSNNSAMYDDGTLTEPPLYLCEAQAYLYQAKVRLAQLATLMEQRDYSHTLLKEARQFKERFNRDFWMEDLGFIPLGLDSQGKPMRVISSNAGHCLESGLLTELRAKKVAQRLMKPDMYNGWGIRTLSTTTKAYNPMSYHNGSVWPHDNAMIAHGFSIVEQYDLAEQVFTGLFEVGRRLHYNRFPELFCGFTRDVDKGDPPVRYPVACSPQAWAAASVFSLIRSCLNIQPKWKERAVVLKKPRLPRWLNALKISNFRVGSTTMDLEFRRTDKTVLVDVPAREGDLDVLVEI
ncbi:MAG: glycogen debranching N-terminal domain-containing protein [Candidatus Melainabacteria bacterium]